jgi:hypothetical protein
MLAPRAALTAVALLASFAVSDGPAVADRAPAGSTPLQPTATPIYVPLTPPPSGPPLPVATAQPGFGPGGTPCMNDQLLSLRTIPEPWKADVIVCGYVTSVSGPGSLSISVNGTKPIPVSGSTLPGVHVGDMVVVHGRYYRYSSGAEKIEVTGPDGLSLMPPRH